MFKQEYAGLCRRMLRPTILAAVIATVFSSASSFAESFVVRTVRVFDGQRVTPDVDVLVDGIKIKTVGKHSDAPPGIKIVGVCRSTLEDQMRGRSASMPPRFRARREQPDTLRFQSSRPDN